MKKISIVLVLAIIVFFSAGCNRQKECFYGLVYNEETNECDCVQKGNRDNIPDITSEEYHNWEDVSAFYEYYVKSKEEYPYNQHEGNTLKVCGWINHYNGQAYHLSPDSLWAAIGLSSDSSAAFSASYFYSINSRIECSPILLDSIDLDQKCFITGTLTFSPYYMFTMMTSQPGCYCPEFALRVTEIHN